MFPPRIERRRSHTFTEGTFEEAIDSRIASSTPSNEKLFNKKKIDLCRQRSVGSPAASDVKSRDTRSPILQHLHKKFFSHDIDRNKSPLSSSEDLTSRSRCGNSPEPIFKRGDNFEFKIPTLSPPQSPLTSPIQRSLRGSPVNSIGELDVELYKNNLSSSSENESSKYEKIANKSSLADDKPLSIVSLACSFQRLGYLDEQEKEKKEGESNCTGTITLSFLLINHHLIIKLNDVALDFKPSSEVREAHWTIHPYLIVDTVYEGHYPTEKSKSHIFHKNHHQGVLTRDTPCEFNLKHRTGEGHALKIVLYDGVFSNKDLAIGVAHFPLAELLTIKGNRETIRTKELTGYHETYNILEGSLLCTLLWQSSEMLFTFGIKTITFGEQASHHHHHHKEMFIKTSVYIGQDEYAEFRTDLDPLAHNIKLDQSYTFEVTPDKVRNMSIFVQVFEKHFLGNISLYRTVIGPYMRPKIKHKTSWEKCILCPGETVTCVCSLYH